MKHVLKYLTAPLALAFAFAIFGAPSAPAADIIMPSSGYAMAAAPCAPNERQNPNCEPSSTPLPGAPNIGPPPALWGRIVSWFVTQGKRIANHIEGYIAGLLIEEGIENADDALDWAAENIPLSSCFVVEETIMCPPAMMY